MNFKWILNIDNEPNRYFYTAKVIAQGIYGQYFYYVLPYLPKSQGDAEKTVYFPKINNIITKADWETLKNEEYKIDKPPVYLNSYNKITKNLQLLTNISETKINNAKKLWDKKSKDFTNILVNKFDIDLSMIETVNIMPTTFGSPGTYNLLNNKKEINIHYRIDQDISTIAKLLLSAIVRKTYLDIKSEIRNFYVKNADWWITESITEFFFRFTTLNQIFPKYISTIKTTEIEKSSEFYRESKEYLTELGFYINPSLKINNNDIYKENGDKLKGLTAQENDVLTCLIHKNVNLCTYEEIAKVMWHESFPDKFSLYAINKVVFQIRQKLKINNILSAKITTIRNKGYILYY